MDTHRLYFSQQVRKQERLNVYCDNVEMLFCPSNMTVYSSCAVCLRSVTYLPLTLQTFSWVGLNMLMLKSAFLCSILLPVFIFHVEVKMTEMTWLSKQWTQIKSVLVKTPELFYLSHFLPFRGFLKGMKKDDKSSYIRTDFWVHIHLHFLVSFTLDITLLFICGLLLYLLHMLEVNK